MILKAKKAFTYRTRRLQAGDVFEAASDRDVKLMLYVGRAEPVLPGVPAEDPVPTIEDPETLEEAAQVRAPRKRKTKAPEADPVPTGDDPYPTDEE